MSRKTINAAVAICLLIGATFAALVSVAEIETPQSSASMLKPTAAKSGPLTLQADLIQNLIYAKGDGRFALSLQLNAPEEAMTDAEPRDVDLVIVLDRSGSMRGQKLVDAKRALSALLDTMTPGDRIALVTYSNTVSVESPLVYCTSQNRDLLQHHLAGIRSGGGTNLGGGLQCGIDLALSGQLESYNDAGMRATKVILVSDGLANHGVTDPYALGSMAAHAVERGCSISTVGLGLDFNELLMTAIADKGTGSYYYLENSRSVAETFTKEFINEKSVAAAQVEVRIPLPEGVELVQAAGYPIESAARIAIFRPGNVHAGQSRKLYLTFEADTQLDREIVLQGITVQYVAHGRVLTAGLAKKLTLTCVADASEAQASVRPDQWEQKVLHEDYNRLREEVARSVKAGDKDEAKEKIERYRQEKTALNERFQSPAVAHNLQQDLGALDKKLDEAFTGNAKEALKKQKSYAKAVQHEGYLERRAKN